ncbi:inositol-pentakisphosphate 2-kinase-like isoform X1 [Babesia ovis]|uniref:Inositol-pentakisphosphate 2-kinase n=1 Tax=Babesia ovis TaxID=5869 RepID=A0A9W5TBR4_BABOV|nr:inositol-pentakisphosphate 2-kinase-like isoform X1 [Babesia ovis]
MRLTPLGAGNCQFVYRVERESWKFTDKSKASWDQCYVLKLPRKPDSALSIRRMLYHDEFCFFMQEGCCNSSDLCTPKRVGCLIDRDVAKTLRLYLSKLLDNDHEGCTHEAEQTCTCKHPVIRGDGYYANWWKVNLFQSDVVYKKRIYHVKEVAQKTTIHIKPSSIRLLGDDSVVYDPLKYELAILEEDLFNISVCVSLGRTLLQTGMRHYRNISVEMKPKCGLLNFSGVPSLFQMCQPYKARIRYQNIIPSDGPDETGHIIEGALGKSKMSDYSPINFFRMTQEDVKRELYYLALAPQNNIRIFVDNIEVDPGILLRDPSCMDNVARCLVENKVTTNRILNIQALASGQQIVAYVLYSLSNVLARIAGERPIEDARVTSKLKIGAITENLMFLSKELLGLVLCEHSNAYRIQNVFNLIGRRLICSLCNILKLFLAVKHVPVCTSRHNISLNRVKQTKRYFPSDRYDANSLYHGLTVHSQGRLLRDYCSNDEAVQLVVFNELESMLSCLNRSLHPAPANSLQRNTEHNNSDGKSPLDSVDKFQAKRRVLLKKCKRALEATRRWIELYLGGRTAMDLSIVLNVLFHESTNKAENKPNFFRFSLIDLDLKPVHRIPRWKDDVLFLVNKQPPLIVDS